MNYMCTLVRCDYVHIIYARVTCRRDFVWGGARHTVFDRIIVNSALIHDLVFCRDPPTPPTQPPAAAAAAPPPTRRPHRDQIPAHASRRTREESLENGSHES